MNPKSKWNLIFVIVILAAVGLACSGNTEKANKLVDEANKLIDEAKPLSDTAQTKNNEVFDKMPASYPEGKDALTTTAKEAVDAYDKASAKLKEASAKFDEASKVDTTDKFKEYLSAKASEMGKRSEYMTALKDNCQAFMDSKDIAELNSRVTANKTKVEALDKEATTFGDKAKKIQDENKDIFKK